MWYQCDPRDKSHIFYFLRIRIHCLTSHYYPTHTITPIKYDTSIGIIQTLLAAAILLLTAIASPASPPVQPAPRSTRTSSTGHSQISVLRTAP